MSRVLSRNALPPRIDRIGLSPTHLSVAAAFFTLLELVLAITVLSLISAAVMANFRVGVMSYKASQDMVEANESIVGGLELLERDCENMIPLENEQVVFEKNLMSFVIIDPSGKIPKLITYKWEDGDLRRSERVFSTLSEGRSPASDSVAVMTGVESLTLEFHWKGEWRSSIPREKGDGKDKAKARSASDDGRPSEESGFGKKSEDVTGAKDEEKENRLPKAVGVSGVQTTKDGRRESFIAAVAFTWRKTQETRQQHQGTESGEQGEGDAARIRRERNQ